MMRFTRAAFLSLLLLGGAASAVHAGDDYCDGGASDPLVKVITPAGNKQYVHLTFSAPSTEYHQNLIDAKNSVSWTVVPTADGTGTIVTVVSTVPLNGLLPFATRATISTIPYGGGTVYSAVAGTAGSPMVNVYTLNVP